MRTTKRTLTIAKGRKSYECPRGQLHILPKGMNLLASLSLEGTFEEDLFDGGDANYEGIDNFDFS